MNTSRYLSSLCIAIGCSFLIILSGCNSKDHRKKLKIDPGFSNYIAAFTSGSISKSSSIKVCLRNDYPGKIVPGSEVNKKLFSFSPDIKGKTYWSDQRTIEFRPDKPLESGEFFDAKFFLSELMEVPAKFSTLEFQFEVITQNFSVATEGLELIDPLNPDYYKLKGVVNTADVIDAPDIETVVNAKFNNKKLNVLWTHDPGQKIHHFEIDSIERGTSGDKLQLEWNGKDLDIDVKGKEEVAIPAKGQFNITRVKVFQDPEQYVVVYFSDPLDPSQNLQGIVRIDNLDNLRIDQEKNLLRIYPVERLSGTRILSVDQSVKNVKGISLQKAFTSELLFEDMKPAVRMTGGGVILPNSDGLILPFEAVNLSKVDITIVKIYENNVGQFLQVNELDGDNELYRVGKKIHKETIQLTKSKVIDYGKWNAFSIDLTKIIVNDPGAIYRVTFSFKKEYSLYDCPGQTSGDAEMEMIEEEVEDYTGNYEYYYNEYDYYYPDGYNWQERENPCHVSYYTHYHFVSRNILASDLGIIAKGGGLNHMLFAVTNLITTEPVNDVDLRVYNYQNQLIGSGKTINNGIVSFNLKEKPYLLIAIKGKQRGYLRLDDGTSLSLSKYDVGGSIVQKGLKGFIYGERGVWRPGDTLFLTFILEDKNKNLPAKYPVTLELFNPQSQLVNRMVNNENLNGFYRFIIPTESNAVTGNWTANVKVGGATFSKTIKIETIKPNRLKVKLDFHDKVLSINKPVSASLQVSWLTGATARDMKTNITVNLTNDRTSFSKYPAYVFQDPTKKFATEEQVIFDGKIDANGIAAISRKMQVGQKSPGMLKAGFLTRVYEESGDFSTDFISVPYAPYSSFVGIRLPDGERYSRMLETDIKHTVDVVTLTPEGIPVSRNGLEVKIYKVNWRWWWNTSDNDLSNYEGTDEFQEVFSTNCSTANGKGSFSFSISYPSWGRYLVWVRDPESNHSTGATVYIDWPSWRSRDRAQSPESATMLNVSSDKKEYKVGEMAEISIPSGGQGRALVSLESGSKILDAFWIVTENKETRCKIKITPEMTPNFYVHITLVQPHSQTVNDLPVRLYGVLPVMVTDPATKLEPLIEMPSVLRPEQLTSIKIREKNGKPMTYTIAIVDEGLLDLTRFKTPDPWNCFYAREALGVKTWDIYDLVIGAFGGKLEGNFAIGGDESSPGKSPKSVNRFKPVVKFLGPFRIGKGGNATHIVKLPQYVGSVRTMVIAGQDGAYGNAEKTTPVRKPLMVLATMPRVLSPGETLKLPVTVFAMEPGIRDVQVKISTNNKLIINGEASRKIQFKQNGDQVVNFDLKVPNLLGIAKVKVTAVCGKETAETEIVLEVRSPNPVVTDFKEKLLKAGETWNQNYQTFGLSNTNKIVLEVSRNFDLNFNRRLAWLIQYPYGCVEQTTSSAFPQLFLSEITDVDPQNMTRIQNNIKSTIQRLQGFQHSDGGFGYWPGAYNADDWSTSYVGHFLMEAERKGYVLPPRMKENWLKYQSLAARNWSPRPNSHPMDYSSSDLIQAYRLYTMALAKSPLLPSMNRLKEVQNLGNEARLRLAAAYALAGKADIARELAINYKTREKTDPGMDEIYGSPERDMGMALETMVLLGEKVKAFKLAGQIAKALKNEHWMSTQTTAYCLLGISKFIASDSPSGNNFNFSYTIDGGKPIKVTTAKGAWNSSITVPKSGSGKIKLFNSGNVLLYARLVISGQPATNDQKTFENNINLNVIYKNMKGNVINPAKISQGTDFYAEVTVRNPGYYGIYKNIALSQVFPSGWEIINYRLNDLSTAVVSDKPDYQDIRDDRVYTFFGLPKLTSKKYIVLLHAAYQGKFFLPGAYCEAMYDNNITARKSGQWVEVFKDVR